MSMDKGKEVNVTSSIITSQQIGHNNYHPAGSRQGLSQSRHENSQQQPQQQYIRPPVYAQAHIRQSAGYQQGIVNDMKPAFPQQSGLAVQAPGQQAATSTMIYTGQHVSNRPPLNPGASPAPMQQPHGGQTYYPRPSGNSGAGGQGGGQGGNQGQQRYVQPSQRAGGMNMPIAMIQTPQTGPSNSQANYFASSHPMFVQPPLGQTHVIYQQHGHPHHTPLPEAVEFSSHPDVLSVSMIPSHSSSARYTTNHSQENGDMGSPAMPYRFPTPQYQYPTLYVPQTSGQYGNQCMFPQQVMMHQSNPRSGVPVNPCMMAPMTNQPTQPPAPNRKKTFITIIDPKTQIDITMDIVNHAGNNPTPPASGASSACGTPPSNVATPPPAQCSVAAAQFARQVAAVAVVSSASTSVQPQAPPIQAVATQSQSSATVASATLLPPTAPAALAAPPVTVSNVGRTKSEKDFNGNQPHVNVSVTPADKPPLNNVVSNDATDSAAVVVGNVAVGVSKELKVAVKVEDEVPPPPPVAVVKVVEKAEPAQQQPHVTAHPTPYVNMAPSTRAVGIIESRETAPAAPSPPVALVKKPDSAPPPPFPASKNTTASEVNASVAPFSALNPSSVMSATDKLSGTRPGSSQMIISAPPDHPPPSSRESAVEHGPPTHLHGQVVVLPAKSASPVVPAPFTQQQGPGQQPGSARPTPAGQGVDPGRLPPGHHHPPITPLPFGPAQPPPVQQPLIHKQQNGEVQPETPKITPPLEVEGPTKDGKQQQQQHAPAAPPPTSTAASHNAKKNRDVKSRSEPKEINSVAAEVVVVEDRIVTPPITNADTPAEVVVVTTVDTTAATETEDISSVATEEEGKATEEMLDKEAKRKVAEKNEENSKVSNMALDKLEKDTPRVISDNVPSIKLPLNLNNLPYKEDQWSPYNLDGKKQYDRDFLLKMQNQPPSLKKPEGLPDLEVIRDDIVNTLISDRMPPTNVNKSRGGQVANDFIPVFVQNPNNKIQTRGGGGGGRNSSQQGRKEQPQQPPKKVVSISLCQEVKLRDSEDPWKPSYKQSKAATEDDPLEKIFKRVRALLNKLTPQNFSSLMGQVDTFGIDTEEKLVGVINLVFEKAINEPNFSVAYANMCKSLSAMKVQSPNSDGVNFRKLIIGRCQTEFEKDANEEVQQREERQKMIDEADPEKKKILQEELEEGIVRSRRRSLGNIRFIGELYKLKMLTGKIMHECVKKLLSENDEDSLECLCRLLTTIGKDLEYPPQTVNPNKPPQGPNKPPQPDNRVAEYFQTMHLIVNKRQTTSRVRFMLLDVIDLRLQGWVPRRDENNPKTIDQIHREAEAEHQEKQLLYQTPIVKRNDDRMDRDRRRDGPGMGGKRGSSENEGWTSVGGGRKTPMTPMPDTSKCRMRMENLDENNIQLGPQTSGWSKGSMGGGRSSHEGDRTPSNQGGNRYSLLTEHSQADGRRGPPRQQQQSHSMPGRDGRNMGGSMSQQLPMSNHRSGGGGGGGGYKGSISREHEQAIANVKNIANNNNDGAGRPHSQPTLQKPPPSVSSRSSSASRESDRESQAKECDKEQLETKMKSTIEEFLTVGDLADAVLSVTEDVPASQMPYFVTYTVNQFLEKSSKARIQIGQLLCELVKKIKLTVDQFWKGMTEIFESAEDLAIDIPKFWEYLAEIISPFYVGEILSLSSLKQSVEPLLGPSQTSVLLANVLKVMSTLSPNGVHNLWRESGLRISQFVPADEVDEFVNRHKLKFLQEEARPASAPFIRKDKILEGLKQEIQTQICGTENNPEPGKGLDKIYNWINQNVSEQQRKDPSFIRALVTAIADRSIKMKEQGSYEIIQPVLDSCWTVIKRYVDNRDELELETLFALQNFVHRLEHPKGLLSHFFHLLYDKEVISDDGFLAWRASEGQEVEGHAVAVKAVNTFLLNIKQYEEEDESA